MNKEELDYDYDAVIEYCKGTAVQSSFEQLAKDMNSLSNLLVNIQDSLHCGLETCPAFLQIYDGFSSVLGYYDGNNGGGAALLGAYAAGIFNACYSEAMSDKNAIENTPLAEYANGGTPGGAGGGGNPGDNTPYPLPTEQPPVSPAPPSDNPGGSDVPGEEPPADQPPVEEPPKEEEVVEEVELSNIDTPINPAYPIPTPEISIMPVEPRLPGIEIPKDIPQTGIIKNYTNYDYFYGRWTKGTAQSELSELWASTGKTSDRGIATINNRYLVAVSPKFGKVGDSIDVTLDNGTVIPCIIADAKGSDAKSEWGHTFGNAVDVIEWESVGGKDVINIDGWAGSKVTNIAQV